MRVQPVAQPRRFLNIHEAYSIELMSSNGLKVPKGYIATTSKGAQAVAKSLCVYSSVMG